MNEVTFLQSACLFMLFLIAVICVFIWKTWRDIKKMDKR
jgi:hypothetical protein